MHERQYTHIRMNLSSLMSGEAQAVMRGPEARNPAEPPDVREPLERYEAGGPGSHDLNGT